MSSRARVHLTSHSLSKSRPHRRRRADKDVSTSQPVNWVAGNKNQAPIQAIACIGGNRPEEKSDRAEDRDSGSVGIAEGTIGAWGRGLTMAEDEHRKIQEKILRDEDERGYGENALEGSREDEPDSNESREKKRHGRRAASVYVSKPDRSPAVAV